MSYGVVRVQKFSAGSVKGIEIHDRREKDVSHTNNDIDRERSEENYDLHPAQNENFPKAVKSRIDELDLKKAVRKDAVVMAQVLVTSDNDFFQGLDYSDNKVNFDTEFMCLSGNQDTTRKFFEDSYKFLCERYGEENVVSATVHMDERTPHMHFNFIPVTADGRLAAKDVLTRASLTEQQDAFFKDVGSHYGLMRGEPKESGKRRVHLETAEFKAVQEELDGLRNEVNEQTRKYEQAKAEVGQAQEDAREARTIVSKVEGAIKTLEEYKKRLQDDVVALETKRDTLTAEEVKDLTGTRTLTGGLKGIKYKDYEALKRTAERVEKVEAEHDRAVDRAAAAEQRAAVAVQAARKAQSESPSIILRVENEGLKQRLERMESRFKRLLEHFPEQLQSIIKTILNDRDPFKQTKKQERER